MEVQVPLGIIAWMCAWAFKKCVWRFWIANGSNYYRLNHSRSLHSSWSWTQQSSSRTTVLIFASNSSDNTNCKHRQYYLICSFPSGSDESGVWICQRLWFTIKILHPNKSFWTKNHFPLRASNIVCFTWGTELLRFCPQDPFLCPHKHSCRGPTSFCHWSYVSSDKLSYLNLFLPL